jgi:hypothetical protein
MCEKYNGWSNRETWAVALHVNNDQGWQESVLGVVREHKDAAMGGDLEPWQAGELIRENVEEALAFPSETVFDPQWFAATMVPIIHDIGSLWRVDWTELGQAFLADLADEDGASC